MKAIHWSYDHLPPHLQAYSRPICELAREFERTLPQSVELNAGLRKLMEAKDCFVRAAIEVYGTKQSDRMAGPKDPVSGQPLPKDSPYSMAHVPVTPEITEGKIVAVYGDVFTSHRETCLATIGEPCNCDCGRSE